MRAARSWRARQATVRALAVTRVSQQPLEGSEQRRDTMRHPLAAVVKAETPGAEAREGRESFEEAFAFSQRQRDSGSDLGVAGGKRYLSEQDG